MEPLPNCFSIWAKRRLQRLALVVVHVCFSEAEWIMAQFLRRRFQSASRPSRRKPPPDDGPLRGRRRSDDVRSAARRRDLHQAKHTVPTGLSGEPPVGPAIPVMANEIMALELSRAPVAISAAVSSLTAPMSARVSGRDAEHFDLGIVGVGDEAAVEPGRTSGRVSDHLGRPATGAGFGGGQRQVRAGVRAWPTCLGEFVQLGIHQQIRSRNTLNKARVSTV